LESPKLKLPLIIKSINQFQYKELNDNIILCALLNNDKSKLSYYAEYYDNDLMKNVIYKRSYFFNAIGIIKIDSLSIFIYDKRGNDTAQMILLTYLNDVFIDKIIINLEIGETEITKYRESMITEKLEIKSKFYEFNPSFNRFEKNANTKISKTIVTISDYYIDKNTGKIILTKEEKKYSDCYPEDFSYKSNNCQLLDYQ
jgi:hypothetical protein